MKNATEIELKCIVPDENQPRKHFDGSKLARLSESVKKHGIMNPLIVEDMGKGMYLLVDGERRYRVASALKMAKVPVVITEPRNAVDRLIQQFHIQEQHENWSPVEKAIAVLSLSKEMGMTIAQISGILGLPSSETSRYMAFANIISMKEYQKSEISLDYAKGIKSLCRTVEGIYGKVLEQEWNRSDERKLELALIGRIASGDVRSRGDLTKLKDTFVQNPSYVEKFMDDKDLSVSKAFIESKAKGAYHLRNASHSANYMATHINRFIEIQGVKPTDNDVFTIKRALAAAKKFLDLVE